MNEFRRRERRYLVADASRIVAECEVRAGAGDSYTVRTFYLDHPDQTWSVGQDAPKYRLRSYRGNPEWWFEQKERRAGVVEKHRRISDVPIPPAPLMTVCEVNYRRRAFEIGDLRVTVDADVRARETLGHFVVEVKGDAIPGWLWQLLPPESRGFSKSKWALGLARVA